uniref:Glycerol-3-phosphate acyltransferase 2, mitochondrial n=1 Tax=Kryptolebias marmoratus TaxID=37003 RepID=A0A3Q3EPD0_KRYMA
IMVQEKNDGINNDMSLPPIQQKRPALSWELKIKKKVKIVPSFLGKLRPAVGQCCHQCTPDSLRKKLGQNSFPGFRNLLNVNETQTRYRGWLVRRVCCVLFVSGCKVYGSPVSDRLERVCQSRDTENETGCHSSEASLSITLVCMVSFFFLLIDTHYFLSLFAKPFSTHYPLFCRFLSWVILKVFASMFGSIQVNLNHLPALHKASQEGAPLVYVYVRHSAVDFSLIPLVLFCHNLRVPYTLCPPQTQTILQKVGVVLLPPSLTELEAEGDPLYSAVMTSLLHELLHEGQVLSVGVSAESGLGGRWLARVRQLIKEGSVPDVSLVPVGISYDRVTKANIQVSALLRLFSAFWKNPEETVRIDFAQPFSLKEMCESGMCRVDEWLPLQDLLLPWCFVNSVFVCLATTSCLAVMSTSLVSSLLLYRHRKGASASVLCRDVAWLTEELLFRNRDVGFGGSLPEVVHYSLTLLAPHLIIAASPSRLGKDPLIVPRPSSALHLSLLAQTVVQTFILEAVGACAVSAMLCEVVFTGVSSDMEFDVVLGQSELAEKALRLCHLLPSGVMPPCQSTQSFALDAVDSLVRCGILIMEEISRDAPICDFMKREGALTWTTTDDPYHSDSDCEEQELRSYKISQPSQCPDMLFFLCSMLAGHLRTLCWTVEALDLMDFLFTLVQKKLSPRSVQIKVRGQKAVVVLLLECPLTLLYLCSLFLIQVLSEERQTGGNFLGVSPLFQLSENREKLQRFISQYLYN